MDTWNTLKNNSSLTTADAYQHLNNPNQAGTGQVVESLTATLTDDSFESEITSSISGTIATDNLAGIIKPDNNLTGKINQTIKGDVNWKL